MGILPTLSPHDKAVKLMLKAFDVQVEKRTNIILASFEAGDPKFAQTVLDTVLRLYEDQHIKVYSGQVSPEIFKVRADEQDQKLQKSEQALADFRAANGILNIEQQKKVMLERSSALKSQVEEATASVSETRARVASPR